MSTADLFAPIDTTVNVFDEDKTDDTKKTEEKSAETTASRSTPEPPPFIPKPQTGSVFKAIEEEEPKEYIPRAKREQMEKAANPFAAPELNEQSAPKANPFAPDSQQSAPKANPFAPDNQQSAPKTNPFAPDNQQSAPKANPFAPDSKQSAPKANPFAPQANPFNSVYTTEQNTSTIAGNDDINSFFTPSSSSSSKPGIFKVTDNEETVSTLSYDELNELMPSSSYKKRK